MNSTALESFVKPRIGNIMSICAGQGVTRDSLKQVLDVVIELAGRAELWGADSYPDPPENELQERYLIHEEPGQTFALYLNVMRPGKKIIPHNHTTWACIAAVDGVENNYLFNRLEGGEGPGHAVIEQADEIVVEPGTGIALMPDDIHAVRIKDQGVIRHLHMYGKALETLTERLAFDMDTNTCRVMHIGVQTKR